MQGSFPLHTTGVSLVLTVVAVTRNNIGNKKEKGGIEPLTVKTKLISLVVHVHCASNANTVNNV